MKSDLRSDTSSIIKPGKRSGLCSHIFVGVCSGIFLSDMCCDLWTNFSPGMCSDMYSDICSGIKDVLTLYFGIKSNVLSGKHSEFYLAKMLAFYLPQLLAFDLASLLAIWHLLGKYFGFLFGMHPGIQSDIISERCPIGSWRLRSATVHCDLELAIEVRQCPLRSGACC